MSEIINTFVFPIIRTDLVIDALMSLHKFTSPNYKTIVINQTRPNSIFERALRDQTDVVITPNVNWGYAQASNIGARITTTDYITVANDDIFFWNDDWWAGIMRAFDKFPNSLGVAPMAPIEPGWGYKDGKDRIFATIDECKNSPDETLKRLKDIKQGSTIDGIAAWMVVFRRKDFIDIGMFDERFFPGGSEDYDLCARASQAGYRMIATSESWVYHYWGKSKDDSDGFARALPNARPHWNKLSTKGFGNEGLWHPDCDCWGHNCTRTDPTVARMPL